MKILRLTVSLPDSVVEDLLLKLNSGESIVDLKFKIIDMTIEKQKAINKRSKEVQNQKKRKIYLFEKDTINPDILCIIEYWNNSKFIAYASKHRDIEKRNFKIDYDKFGTNSVKIVKKAIADIGVDKIKEEMDKYFDRCEKGEHIWDSTNHGFKNVVGFLTKLLKIERIGGPAWWEDMSVKLDDEDPRVTQMLADLFAEKFLDRDKFIIEQNSKEHVYFIKFRKLLIKRMTKQQNIRFAADIVFNALRESYSVVQPKQLCSKNTWTVLIPQYLKSIS